MSNIQEHKVIMPGKLTAENGAKKLLMGEFTIPFPVQCDDCDGTEYIPDEYGEDCPSGEVALDINVPWTVIKEIYAKAVEHLSQPFNSADAEGRCGWCEKSKNDFNFNYCPWCGRRC